MQTRKSILLEVRLIIEQDDDCFFGYCPDLEGVLAQGDTLDETREFLKETVLVHIESMLMNNVPLPTTLLPSTETESSVLDLPPNAECKNSITEIENLEMAFA